MFIPQARTFLLFIFAILGFLATASVSSADVTYTFLGSNPPPGGVGLTLTFQYTSPTFITGSGPYDELLVYASQLDSCTHCVMSSVIPAVVFSGQGTNVEDEIEFNDIDNEEAVFMFPSDPFEAVGTYTTISLSNPGTLVVSAGLGAVSTPEPSTLLLLGCGLAFLTILSFAKSWSKGFTCGAVRRPADARQASRSVAGSRGFGGVDQ